MRWNFIARAAGVPCRRTNPEPQQRAAGNAVGNTKLWNPSIWGIFQPWNLRLRNKLYLGMIGRPGLSLYILGVGWQNAQKVQERPTVDISVCGFFRMLGICLEAKLEWSSCFCGHIPCASKIEIYGLTEFSFPVGRPAESCDMMQPKRVARIVLMLFDKGEVLHVVTWCLLAT